MIQQKEKPDSSNLSPDTKTGSSNTYTGGRYYEIHVKGHLSELWTDWFEGLTLEQLDEGEMVLSGTIVDQAALMGILNKINRLNLTLLCVQYLERKE